MSQTEYIMGRKANCRWLPYSSTCSRGLSLLPLKHSTGSNLSWASLLTLVGKSSNISAIMGEAEGGVGRGGASSPRALAEGAITLVGLPLLLDVMFDAAKLAFASDELSILVESKLGTPSDTLSPTRALFELASFRIDPTCCRNGCCNVCYWFVQLQPPIPKNNENPRTSHFPCQVAAPRESHPNGGT